MASKWVKCTMDGKSVIHVNLGLALTLTRIKDYTRIAFAGGGADHIDVKETPEEILKGAGN